MIQIPKRSLRTRLGRLLWSFDEIEELLEVEKEKRGVPKERLVFVDIGNVLESSFCEWRALNECYEGEEDAFRGYIWYRANYGARFGYYKDLPSDGVELIDLLRGFQIRKEDVDRLLKLVSRRVWKIRWREDNIILPVGPKNIIFIHDKEFIGAKFRPFYPSIGWGFDFAGMVFVCKPTGISDDSVYIYGLFDRAIELFRNKSTLSLEGDIYGYFFQRKRKVLEIQIIAEKRCLIFEEEVNEDRARNFLRSFARKVTTGQIELPSALECENCFHSLECSMSKYCK